MNFYMHHLGDYALATQHLSWDEDLAYRRMLCLYYQTEQPLPLDYEEIARLIGWGLDTRKKTKLVIAITTLCFSYFEKREDGWHQKRCDEEIQAAENKRKQARINGHFGGRPNNPKEPTSVITEPTTKASQTPIPDSRLQTKEVREEKEKILELREGEKPASRHNGLETSNIWTGYQEAYRERYGTEPVRNASVNAKLKQFSQRIPNGEGAEIAAFFVRQNDAFYLSRGHPVGLLLNDAEKLRTQWKTGRRESLSPNRSQSAQAMVALEEWKNGN